MLFVKGCRSATFKERLKEAMDTRKVSQADLARATGLSKGGISNYVLGRYEPKTEIIKKLASALNCSESWLQGYDVPMRPKQEKIYSYDDNNACCWEEENPVLLEIEEYLATLSMEELENELNRLKQMDRKDFVPALVLTDQEKTLLRLFREASEEGKMRMIQSVLNVHDAEIKSSDSAGNSSLA